MPRPSTVARIVIDDAFIGEWHPKYDLTENDEGEYRRLILTVAQDLDSVGTISKAGGRQNNGRHSFGAASFTVSVKGAGVDFFSAIQRFADAIARGGSLDTLVQQIAKRESELKAITNRLLSTSAGSIDGRLQEIRQFVTTGISDLRSLLGRDTVSRKQSCTAI
jgi:hypothetical protein